MEHQHVCGNLIKGEVQRHLHSMSNKELLGWVDDMVIQQLDDDRLEQLVKHLQGKLVARRQRWAGAIRDLMGVVPK